MSQHRLANDLSLAHFPAAQGLVYIPTASGYAMGYGTTAPTSGYVPGAIWIDTDSTEAYKNTGTAATCTWTALSDALGRTAQTFGNTAHAGLLAGAGTSGTPYTMTGASKSALSFYVTTADTADSNRAAYFRLYLTGAAGGGEALRAMGTGNAANLTAVRGAHISAGLGASGTVAGEMQAIKGTVHFPDAGIAAGTISAIQAEVYAETGGTNGNLVGSHGVLHLNVNADADDAQSAKWLNAIMVTTPSNCVGNKAAQLMVSNADVTGNGAAGAAGLRVLVNGTPYWIALYSI